MARATTLEELGVKLGQTFSAESRAAGLAFRPRATDVIIAPFPKCGTTWLQQMVHSLRTGGDVEFDDISRVVPWIETAGALGIDLDAPQRAEPRAFKSHLAWPDIPKGCRYIVAVRDPLDALVSVYRFFEGWWFEPGTIDIESFGRARFVEPRDYYRHLGSWWERRDEPDTLLLAYELMTKDAEATIRRVAEFIGVDATEAVVAAALDESSLASMSARKDRYDDLMTRTLSEERSGIPPGSESSKVRSGAVGEGRLELSDALLDELARAWDETIGARFGLRDYRALLACLA